MEINVLRFDSIGSTNTEAAEQARRGADEGLCVVADEQTAGRGRHGRTWVSGKGSGLYFSLVLRPKLSAAELPLITLMAGVAVHDALAEYGISPDIKWVNDLLVGERKISGILAEATDTPMGLAVIVGIGINIRDTNFPPEIAETATSIESAGGGRRSIDEVCETMTKYLSYFYAILSGDGGAAAIVDEWQRRSTYARGKRVRVTAADGIVDGTTDGLEPNGALRLITADGRRITIQTGDVERLREVQ